MTKNNEEHREAIAGVFVVSDRYIFENEFNKNVLQCLTENKDINCLMVTVHTCYDNTLYHADLKKERYYDYVININIDIGDIRNNAKSDEMLIIKINQKLFHYYKDQITVH